MNRLSTNRLSTRLAGWAGGLALGLTMACCGLTDALAASYGGLPALGGLSEEQQEQLRQRLEEGGDSVDDDGDDAAILDPRRAMQRQSGPSDAGQRRAMQARGSAQDQEFEDVPGRPNRKPDIQTAKGRAQQQRAKDARDCAWQLKERLRDTASAGTDRTAGSVPGLKRRSKSDGSSADGSRRGSDDAWLVGNDGEPYLSKDAISCSPEQLETYIAQTYPFGRFLDRPPLFGYELFDQASDSFQSDSELPVPTDYVLGPGDKVQVQLFGKENRRLSLTVTRDGTLQFPQLGPISVAGMSFDEVQEMLQTEVAESMIGVEASVTMGTLRSIQVFVLGDVRRPGSYTVSSMSTVTNALFTGGGIRETGSLRTVQLKRTGQLVTTLDLYDLLLRGDTSNDLRLQPGDVVFVPPVGKTVSISGEVVRPATYELVGSSTVAELIKLGGGLLPTAYTQEASLERVRGQADRTVATLNLSKPSGTSTSVQTGDHLRVFSVFDRAENVVVLTGALERPGLIEWNDSMRLVDAIPDLHRLKPNADRDYVLIRRETGAERRIETISAHLSDALNDPQSPENILLRSRDQIFVFTVDGKREELLRPVLDQLEQQGSMMQNAQVVEIVGRVKSPGVYPLTAPMPVVELLRAAGGGTDDAYPREIEITRRSVREGQRREITRVMVDLSDPQAAMTPLWPYDIVNVRPIEGWNKSEVVTVSGEVRLPGSYVIQPNETMDSVIRRAGGFTEQAYLQGTVFSREEIRQRQQEELQRQGKRLRAELLQVQLDYRGPDKADIDVDRVRQLGALLSEELSDAEALGRIVIDMRSALTGEKPVILRGGDTVTVPRQPSEVTVLGEVNYPTTHLYQQNYSYKDYLRLSGGFSSRADKSSAFVVRINGEVLALASADEVRPGDVVIVPFRVDRGRGLFVTATIAQIIGQLAITAASFKTVGVF